MADSIYEQSEESRAIPMYSGKWWCAKIEAAEKELDKKWRSSGQRAVDRYLDDRQDEPLEGAKRRYNIFWANVQILKSALYATPPKPSVQREYSDAKDDVGRASALMLQRMLTSSLQSNNSDTHNSLKAAVEDRLLPGLGAVWLRYEADTETQTAYDDFGAAIEIDKILDERVCTDYVHWRDFIWSPARRWEDVWWVCRRVWMKKRKFTKRFGKEKWEDVKNSTLTEEQRAAMPKGFRNGRAEVLEIWCDDTQKVYWANSNLDGLLDSMDDPLGLEDFFPCPPPLLATHTNQSMIPRADYAMVQDQYEELDILNDRISTLTKALRIVGAYDSTNTALAQMLTGPEFAMIGVENWDSMREGGGISESVQWFPIEQIANALQKLQEMRREVIGQIYELTSISDIMRGSSNPRETAKAQSLKAQYSSVRLQLNQQEVAQFAQNTLKLKAEIICKHFQPETIIKQSLIMQTDSAQFAQPALALLKDFKQTDYRLNIAEETLSMADYNAERETRIELVTAVGQFMSQASQMVEGMPGALPYMLRIVQWVVASFRGSADVESVLDEAVTAAQSAPPPQGEPPKPDHSLEVAQLRAQSEQARIAADKEIAQAKIVADERLQQIKAESDERMRQMMENARIELENIRATGAARAKMYDALSTIGKDVSESAEVEEEDETMGKIDETLQKLAQSVEEQGQEIGKTTDMLQLLIKQVAKPRKRTPVRDSDGEIIYVNETIGE